MKKLLTTLFCLMIALPTLAAEPTAQKDSPVWTGAGAPKQFQITVATSGDTLLTDEDGDPVLLPWGAVVQVSCPSLSGTNEVLACWSMHIDATVNVAGPTIADGTYTENCHGMTLDAAVQADDMRLDVAHFVTSTATTAGAQWTKGSSGMCVAKGTPWHGAACTTAGAAADCGLLGRCTGNGLYTQGAWLIFDGTASTLCNVRVDL